MPRDLDANGGPTCGETDRCRASVDFWRSTSKADSVNTNPLGGDFVGLFCSFLGVADGDAGEAVIGVHQIVGVKAGDSSKQLFNLALITDDEIG